jgi:hypothetical protein
MADFCNICAKHMWGDKDDDLQPIPPDIDVFQEFKKLEPDTYVTVGICEGCGLVAVANIHGKLKVAYLKPDGSAATWEEYSDKFNT